MNEKIIKSVRAISEDSAAFMMAMKTDGKIDAEMLRKIGDEYRELASQLEADGCVSESDETIDPFQEMRSAIEAMATGPTSCEHEDTVDVDREMGELPLLPSAIAKRLRDQFGKN